MKNKQTHHHQPHHNVAERVVAKLCGLEHEYTRWSSTSQHVGAVNY